MKGKVLVALALIVIISGCATLRAGFAKRDVQKAVELINSQEADALSFHSGRPFIFEGEILFRSADIEAVWRHLSDNGFAFNNPRIVEAYRSDESTYKVFSESEEMKLLFKKYVPAGSTVGRIDTEEGSYYLLLGSGTGGYPAIIGLTGF